MCNRREVSEMQLKKKLTLILACVVSICCLNVGAVATETLGDNSIIEITQGPMRASKTFEVITQQRALSTVAK